MPTPILKVENNQFYNKIYSLKKKIGVSID